MRIELEKAIPPIPPPKDTKYVRHVRIQSDGSRGSGAGPCTSARSCCCPTASTSTRRRATRSRSSTATSRRRSTDFREEPPDPSLPCEYSERFRLDCYNRIQQEQAHQLYQDWTSPGFPRFLVVQIQHANPYYDDSYAVNSENLGPYGDAIQYELVPVRREDVPRPRPGLGALLVRRLDGRLGGARGAGLLPGRVQRLLGGLPRPDRLPRLHDDEPLRGRERLLDARGRSAGCRARPTATGWATSRRRSSRRTGSSWCSARRAARAGSSTSGRPSTRRSGADGYPKRICDKRTGVIDHGGRRALAGELRPRPHPARDWSKGLGRKLEGKIHIYVGDMDNYYLNNAVYLRRGVPEGDERPALRRRGGLRRPGRALLERRPHAAERLLAPALRPDVRPEDGRADGEERAAGRRPHELALLEANPQRQREVGGVATAARRAGEAVGVSPDVAPAHLEQEADATFERDVDRDSGVEAGIGRRARAE